MTTAERHHPGRWRISHLDVSGRSDLAEETIEAVEVDPGASIDYWSLQGTDTDSEHALGTLVIETKPSAEGANPLTAPEAIWGSSVISKRTMPLLSFTGTVSDQYLRSASPVDIILRSIGSEEAPQALARDWRRVVRKISGIVFADEGLDILRLHELTHPSHLRPLHVLDAVDIEGGADRGAGNDLVEHTPPVSDSEQVTDEQRSNAEQWLRACASQRRASWEEPHRSDSPWGEVVFEWWQGDKKLTVYFGRDVIEYIKVWGDDIDEEMDDGTLDDLSDFDELWRWLRT